MNIDDLCYKVCRAHARCTDRQQVLDIRHWVFDLSIHVVHHLAKVNSMSVQVAYD